jgi:predicted PurR-regulated permease PerM
MQYQARFSPLARAVIIAAAVCVLVLFVRSMASIIAPVLLALFIAVVSTPPLEWMRRKGMPKYLAVLIILLVLIDIGSLIALTTTGALESLGETLPRFQERLTLLGEQLGRWLESIGIERSRVAVRDLINPASVSQLIYGVLANASSVVGTGFLVLLIVAFMLIEAGSLPAKLQAAFPKASACEGHLQHLFTAVNRYMLIKCLVSLITAVCIWIWLRIFEIQYAAALAVTAFLCNFIPIVGNILMTVPAVLVALMQADLSRALLVVLGYVIVNVAIGNILEPRLTGRGLGISSVVVLLSLLFWGWVLGPIGLFLSVPLTMTLMTALNGSPDTRPIAIMLGSKIDQSVAADGKPAEGEAGMARDGPDAPR